MSLCTVWTVYVPYGPEKLSLEVEPIGFYLLKIINLMFLSSNSQIYQFSKGPQGPKKVPKRSQKNPKKIPQKSPKGPQKVSKVPKVKM